MEYGIEQLKRAKIFMDKLADGINPVTNTDVDADTLRNAQIIDCFKYVSNVLDEDIKHNAQRRKYGKKAVYITQDQISKLQIVEKCKVSDIAKEINKVIEENETRCFQSVWISDWLVANGYLYKNTNGIRVASEEGEKIGITSQLIKRQRDDNKQDFYVNYYNSNAQKIIFQHLDDILTLRYGTQKVISEMFRNLDFPYNLSLNEFLNNNQEKCFIIATGSCEQSRKKGSYQVVLFYKGKTKKIQKNYIDSTSTNICILYGIMEAVSYIKIPIDILILTSTPLGFNSTKSRNYQLCTQIIDALKEKNCNIFISVCRGKTEELNRFVKSTI